MAPNARPISFDHRFASVSIGAFFLFLLEFPMKIVAWFAKKTFSKVPLFVQNRSTDSENLS